MIYLLHVKAQRIKLIGRVVDPLRYPQNLGSVSCTVVSLAYPPASKTPEFAVDLMINYGRPVFLLKLNAEKALSVRLLTNV